MTTAEQLFADGYRITSRAYRTASRCPPDVDPGELLRAVGGPPLRGKCAADFYRRCYSKEKVTVSDTVVRQLVRLAHEQDDRDRAAWAARLAVHPSAARGGWCAVIDDVVVARGRSKQNARNRALQLLSDFTSAATTEQVAAQLGLARAATPPPAAPPS